ncbi:MAG TPA: exodeoxyribonuclease VII large subunit [Solirubrobacterales bacterium]|nr:exodeoxyribonuclease VII large subunit [Solirubrobacterales bacterium]
MEQAKVQGGASGSTLPGPYAVGSYARKLQGWMRERAKVQLLGEVTGVSRSKVQAYFELRDGDGAVPCTIWLNDLERAGLPEGALRDGAEVVIGGGPDYYPGGAQASPSFSFRATHVRLAGEGDLLARLEALRKQLRAEGLFELQKQLARPRLPKTIGVVTAEAGAARRDLLAGLHRRGWGGTVVWAFAPVQDRHAAPAIATAIRDLAARPEVEAIVVTRGGGSLADLWAFCDETLCRTVAMLRVPVVSAIGHERDSTLIDDVAAVACSTPTHAAEAAVPLDCAAARQSLARCAISLRRAGESAIGGRGRHLAALARGPARALQRQRVILNQKIREIRAAAERGLTERTGFQRRIAAVVLDRARRRGAERAAAGAEANRRRNAGIERGVEAGLRARREALRQAAVTLRAHDPDRTLERGYALAEGPGGEPVTSAVAAVAAAKVRLRFSDGRVDAEIGGGVERDDGAGRGAGDGRGAG